MVSTEGATDINIRKFISPNGKNYSPDQPKIDELYKTELLERNCYYWDNILFSLTKDPSNILIKSIINGMDNKFNKTSLHDVLIQWNKYYVEAILQECKNSRPDHMTMPLVRKNNNKTIKNKELINRITNYKKNSTISHQIPLDKNQAIKHQREVFPVRPNQVKVSLANLFKMDPWDIWYPLDSEGFPILRSVFHLLLRKHGLDIPFLRMGKIVRWDLSPTDFAKLSFTKFCEYFISHIPKKGKITIELVNHFNTGIYESPLSHFILQLARDIQEASTSSTYDEMDNLNINIISRIKSSLGLVDSSSTDNTNNTGNVQCKTTINYNVLRQTIMCNSSLNAQDIVQVLYNYPNLQDGSNIMSLDVCPIKTKYIISIFPYYLGKHITVEDSIIRIVPIKDEYKSTKFPIKCVPIKDEYNSSKVPIKFLYLKSSVDFDGNYEKFRTIIKSTHFESAEQYEISSIFYNLNGFSCGVIAAEIINHYNNIQTNSENMYILLSKLSTFQLKSLDNALESTCKLVENKMDPTTLLFESMIFKGQSTRHISTKRVEKAMETLLKTPSFASKINLASSPNYSFLAAEIIYFCQNQYPLNSKEKESIMLLLLYSDVSDMIKKWAHDSLPEHKCISKDDITPTTLSEHNDNNNSISMPTANNNDIDTNQKIDYFVKPLLINKIYKIGIEKGFNLKNSILDLLNYVEQTKDWVVLDLIQTIMIQ